MCVYVVDSVEYAFVASVKGWLPPHIPNREGKAGGCDKMQARHCNRLVPRPPIYLL